MMGARFILLLLWPVLWLAGTAQAHIVATRVAPAASMRARAWVDGGESRAVVTHFQGMHFRGGVRGHRRGDWRAIADGPGGTLTLDAAEVSHWSGAVDVRAVGVSPLELVNGWQFLWRAASTPRAPSLVC